MISKLKKPESQKQAPGTLLEAGTEAKKEPQGWRDFSVPGLFYLESWRLSMQEKEFLTELEMSVLIGRSVQTLRNDRFNKAGVTLR